MSKTQGWGVLPYISQIGIVNSRLADTPIIRTAAKLLGKTNYRRLTEIKSRYYGLLIMRTLISGPYSVRYKGPVDCNSDIISA